MSLSHWLALGVPLWLSAAIGCASTPSVYGDRARFSPAFQGYVMAANDGSDDPAKDETVLLLRDPVTGNKLRCREDVLEWREIYEDVATDQLHNHHAAIAAGVTAGAIFGPLLVLEPVGALVLVEALSITEAFYDILRAASPEQLYATAAALHDRKRYPQASQLLERALARNGSLGTTHKAYYYLGLSYAEQGKQARARVALSAFMDRAAVRDVDGYRRAEAALRSLGVVRKPCGSTDPVELYW